MPSATRRGALAALSTALLAGCSVPRLGPGRTVFSRDVRIPPGEFHGVPFALDAERTVRFGIEVETGPNVDVFLLGDDAYAAYRDGRDFEYRWASGLDVASGFAEDSAVPAGEYAVVYDNTDRGDATPDGRPVVGHATVAVEPAG
jgi:hypothetical protein